MSAYVEDAKDRLIVWNGNADKRGALTPEFYQTILDAVERAKDRRWLWRCVFLAALWLLSACWRWVQ